MGGIAISKQKKCGMVGLTGKKTGVKAGYETPIVYPLKLTDTIVLSWSGTPLAVEYRLDSLRMIPKFLFWKIVLR